MSGNLRVWRLIRSLFSDGFFHIVGAGTLNKAMSTVLSIVLVRVLSKVDYGTYSFAFSIVSIFVLFNGLGATSAALQLCCELSNEPSRSDAVFSYAYRVSALVGGAFLICIVGMAMFVPLSIPASAPLLALYCLYPMLQQLCDIKIVRLRVQLKNKEYAFATNVQTVAMCAMSIIGSLLFGAAGLVVGQTASLALTYLWLCIRFPFRNESGGKRRLASGDKRQYWNISLISAFNNGISQALTLVGNLLIASLTANELMVSDYRVATTIPFALLFVPSAIVTYIYPHFVQHKDVRSWTTRNFKLLVVGSAGLMGTITLFFCLFAEPIMELVFGDQYLDAVPAMRVLMIGFFLTATFRTPAGNLLVTQRRLVANSVIGVILVVVCIAASYLLIPPMGMIGAALVYDACMLIGSILTVGTYVSVIRKLS